MALNGIDVPISPEPPEVMHIDLNGAFAMTEQQWRPHLRGRPVGVSNRVKVAGTERLADYSICITSSYEAKRQGIVIGTRQRDARLIDPSFVMVESDPAKYIHVHRKLKGIFQDYSPTAFMKSIDEGVIDFRGMRQLLKGRPLEDIGREIKQRVREEVGDYMTVNVGIGQNLWLAKVAAGLNKPNGLDVISADNLREVYGSLRLTDLPYIKRRNQVRLNMAGIRTPVDFLRAPYWVLFRQVFGSVLGHHWYFKLRGYETETWQDATRTAGRQYVLEHRTADPEQILALLHKASFKVSRKLRMAGLEARGLALGLRYRAASPDESFYSQRWRDRHKWPAPAHRPDELYNRAKWLFEHSPSGEVVTAFDLTAYGLAPIRQEQPALFVDEYTKKSQVQDAIDQLYDRYGELIVASADVAMSKNPMKDKVPFYSTKYFDIVGGA
ncbi:MAG TPA: hypothetical protein VLF21_01875 [Candidatus Saccharimonadales bacterium]|nr:hypothetical protein [Candidatus Saccharimonadales bacterium]